MNILRTITLVGLIAFCGLTPRTAQAGYFTKTVAVVTVSAVFLGGYMLWKYMTTLKVAPETPKSSGGAETKMTPNGSLQSAPVVDKCVEKKDESEYIKQNGSWVPNPNCKPKPIATKPFEKTKEEKKKYAQQFGKKVMHTN